MSMMQHANVTSERYELAINPLIEESIHSTYTMLHAQFPDLDAVIYKELDASAGSLMIAPQEIGRVLQNIFANAFEAVYAKKRSISESYEPKISVTSSRKNGQVNISISDNGPGIPRNIHHKIFEPFYTTKPTGSGTGLGLSLSYEIIVKGHRGSLTVESQPGEGATFFIGLPVVV